MNLRELCGMFGCTLGIIKSWVYSRGLEKFGVYISNFPIFKSKLHVAENRPTLLFPH